MSRLRAIVVGTIGGVMLAGGLTFTMNARAYTCCDPWGVPGANAFLAAGNVMTTAVTTSVQTVTQYVEQYIFNTIENGIGSIFQEIAKRTATSKVIAEGYVESLTQIYIEGKRADALAHMPREGEFDSALVSGMLLAEQTTAEIAQRQELGREFMDRTIYGPFQNPQLARLQERGGTCTALGQMLGICTAPAISEAGFSDVSVDVILGSGKEITLSDERRKAAFDFVEMIVDSGLQAQMHAGTPQAAQAEAIALADQAVMSLVANSLLEMTAERSRRNQESHLTQGTTP